MANVYKRVGGKGRFSWYARYCDPITGKDTKKKLKAKTKLEAELEFAQILNNISSDDYQLKLLQRKVTFFEIAEDFLDYSRARKRSYEKDRVSVRRLKQFIGDITCERIRRSLFDKFIALRKAGEGDLGESAVSATINRELACAKTIFRRAHMDGKIAVNPMLGFKLLAEDNIRDRVLDDDEFNKLLFASPSHIRPVLIMAWETGMRRNEMLYLKWGQVDLNIGVIKLSGEGTKTGKGRQVPISSFLMSTLKKLDRFNEWVFDYKGEHLRSIRTAFEIARMRAGIEDFRFHDLRHCFVTKMRRKGVPDRVIMAITGHQTMECFKRYDTITLDDLKLAVGVEVPKSWNNSGTNGT